MVIAGTNLRFPAGNRDLVLSAVMWLVPEHLPTGSRAASAAINLRSMVANPSLALNADKSPVVSFEVDRRTRDIGFVKEHF